ncbi:glutaredoxin family protein [Candidatus Dojkabacteria bacterium]|uniref:Glutaredoxin family protein n=1 Tax=Candidatus Dojkabacteria bacterium TaxID=2099670 RepID=A0A955RH43_9BACT|nr:glutaredoxin family protein [Candidatus Dojkabacteria bacterium]
MNKKVRLYGADWCSDCIRAKVFLENHNIDFEYIDVDQDEKANQYVVEVNPNKNRTIPVIEIEGREDRLIEPTNAELKRFFEI